MRLRSFATLLVCAALAACNGDDDTILPPANNTLPGYWTSNQQISAPATFPDGNRAVLARMDLMLGPNGQFRRELRYVDPVNGIEFPDVIWEGSYTASDGNAQVIITRVYARLGGAPVTNPAPQATPPATETFTYSFQDGMLTFSYICPPNALCGKDPFERYTRVMPD